MFDKTIHTHETTRNSSLVSQVWLFLSPKLLINRKEGILNLSALWPHAFCTAHELDPSEGSEQWVAQRSGSHLLTTSGALKQNPTQLIAACSAAWSRAAGYTLGEECLEPQASWSSWIQVRAFRTQGKRHHPFFLCVSSAVKSLSLFLAWGILNPRSYFPGEYFNAPGEQK